MQVLKMTVLDRGSRLDFGGMDARDRLLYQVNLAPTMVAPEKQAGHFACVEALYETTICVKIGFEIQFLHKSGGDTSALIDAHIFAVCYWHHRINFSALP